MPLTDTQIAKINLKRKSTLPTYYSADSDSDQAIPQETEDALILSTPTAKGKAVAYLKLLSDSSAASPDYLALLSQFAGQLATNSSSRQSELDTILQQFTAFRDGLSQGSDQEPFVTGLYPLLKIMNKGLGNLYKKRKESKLYNQLETVATDFYESPLTDNEKRELRSWIRVILSYP